MRLAPLRKSELDSEQLELFQALIGKSVGRDESFVLDETGAVRGPFAAILRHPRSGNALKEMAAALRFNGLLPDLAREAVILVVAVHWDAGHEWWAHEPVARRAGMTDEQLAALKAGERATFDDDVAQAAHDAARAIVLRDDLTDDEYAAAVGVLGEQLLVEVTVLIGYYSLLSMQLRVFRVPTPDHH